MPDDTILASESRRSGNRIVIGGLIAIVAILLVAAVLLFSNLPDANAFNARVERIFIENDTLTSEPRSSSLRFSPLRDCLFRSADLLPHGDLRAFGLATAMLIAALVFLVMLVVMNRRLAAIERSGIQVNSLLISREEKAVYLNNMDFKLTDAAMETLSVLAEARLDDDVLSGAEIEAVISGKPAADCEEAAGATRIKRLRDSLGNQLVSELLVKNIARKGYMLSIDKDVIRML